MRVCVFVLRKWITTAADKSKLIMYTRERRSPSPDQTSWTDVTLVSQSFLTFRCVMGRFRFCIACRAFYLSVRRQSVGISSGTRGRGLHPRYRSRGKND